MLGGIMKVIALFGVGAMLAVAAWGPSASVGEQAGASANASQRTDRAVSSSAQTSAGMNAQAGAEEAGISADAAIEGELTKSVDARRSKPGDEVVARLRNDLRQDGKVVLRHGTRLIGHVTEAQARANGAATSELGLVFDRAELKGGQSIELHAAIQAIAPAAQAGYDESPMGDVGTSPSSGGRGGSGGGMGGGAAGGGAFGSVGSTAGGVAGTAGSAVGGAVQDAGSTVAREGRGAGRGVALTSSSRGVIGFPGVQISAELSNATKGTVLVSNQKDIRLDGGTQVLLRVIAQPPRHQ